jgi:hypothetical protein
MVASKVGPFVIIEPKSKEVNNEKEMQELDKLRIEVSNSRSQQKFLEI